MIEAAHKTNLRRKKVEFQEVVWKQNFIMSDAAKRFLAKLTPNYT